MLDITQIKPYNEFHYWFVRESRDRFVIYEKDATTNTAKQSTVNMQYISGNVYRLYDLTGDIPVDTSDAIKDDFEAFKFRPEYYVGNQFHNPEEVSQDNLITAYECILVGCALIRARNNQLKALNTSEDYSSTFTDFNPDVVIPKAMRVVEYLRTTDFYSAPASTVYHESIPCGLLIHTFKVICDIIELREISMFKNVAIDSAVLCASVHDWCKIGLYQSYMRNVKNEVTGSWDKIPSFKHSDNPTFNYGHGVSSMFAASRFFQLSTQEALAIRWHMGEYNVAHNEMNELHNANEQYPLVQLLQFADRTSITKYR